MCTRPMPAQRAGGKVKLLGRDAEPAKVYLDGSPELRTRAHWRTKAQMMQLPCGYCMECRLAKKRDWALRATHEASLTNHKNCFVTLTYRDEDLPADLSVRKGVLQKFCQDLRDAVSAFRYLGCGEYGSPENTYRPHYHLCLFGIDFLEDRYFWRKTRAGHNLFRSPTLEKIWPFGFSTIGALSPDSAAYVASYTTKKIVGTTEKALELRQERYGRSDQYTRWFVEPEFALMSRRPGLGADWITNHFADVYGTKSHPRSSCLLKGKEVRPPRFYDKALEKHDPEHYALVQELRRKEAAESEDDHARKKAREIIFDSRARLFGHPDIGEHSGILRPE